MRAFVLVLSALASALAGPQRPAVAAFFPDTSRAQLPEGPQSQGFGKQQLRDEALFVQQHQEEQDESLPRRVQQRQSAFKDEQSKPEVAIVHSAYNLPNGDSSAFEYSFESENGIKQEAAGELRTVDETPVIVMKGQYEYVGDDGETYAVDWYADETGYHASAPHLPQPVPIPFAEQAAAVEAQLKFAEEHPEQPQNEDEGGANRGRRNSFPGQLVSPPQLLTAPGVQAAAPIAYPVTRQDIRHQRRP
jgi:hypothetical protein